MNDNELLAMARQHEALLVRVHNGEMFKAVDDAVELAKKEDTATNMFIAQMMLIIGKPIFGWSTDELLVRLKELQ